MRGFRWRAREMLWRLLMWGLLVVLVVPGCGGEGRGSVAVRIGSLAITAHSVDHWSTVLADEGRTAGPSARERALELLISSEWIVGEAAHRGMTVHGSEIERKIAAKRSTGGEDALTEVMKWTGRNISDLRYEIRTELAAARLQHYMARQEAIAARIPRAQVLRYYNREPQFRHSERRTFNFIEYLPSLAAGRRMAAEIRRGKRIASVAIRETRERPSPLPVPGDVNGKIHTAIFRASPHVLVGPLPWNDSYAIFEVTRIILPGRQPLAKVQSAIEQKLAAEAREQMHAFVLDTWRARWRDLTKCRPGFVVQSCREYKRAPVSELDPFTSL